MLTFCIFLVDTSPVSETSTAEVLSASTEKTTVYTNQQTTQGALSTFISVPSPTQAEPSEISSPQHTTETITTEYFKTQETINQYPSRGRVTMTDKGEEEIITKDFAATSMEQITDDNSLLNNNISTSIVSATDPTGHFASEDDSLQLLTTDIMFSPDDNLSNSVSKHIKNTLKTTSSVSNTVSIPSSFAVKFSEKGTDETITDFTSNKGRAYTSTPTSILRRLSSTHYNQEKTTYSFPKTVTTMTSLVARAPHDRTKQLFRTKPLRPKNLPSDHINPDTEPLAIFMGTTAIFIVLSFVIGIVMIDLTAIIRDFKMMRRNIKSFIRYHRNRRLQKT